MSCARLLASGSFVLVCLLGCDPEILIGYAVQHADAEIDDESPRPIEITWHSGAHVGHEVAYYEAFSAWRGRDVDFAHVFADRTSWQNLVQPAWPFGTFASFEGYLMFSVPLFPEGLGTLEACAAGDYDMHWRLLGPFLEARNRLDTIVRLGWGVNDLDHAWHGDGAIETWVECYRRVVLAVRASHPELRFEWSFNPVGPSEIASFDPYEAYPGDDVVDFIGLEVFDMYPPASSRAQWQAACDAPTGLCTLLEFARSHGKQVGLPEWGVASCEEGAEITGNIGGDNPRFVDELLATLTENADLVAHEAYFEGTELCTHIQGDRNPQTAARYQAIYGAQ